MRFTSLVSSLQYAVAACASVAPRKSTMPILHSVLLDVSDDAISVSASDLEVSIYKHVPGADITNAGRACVNAVALNSVLKSLPQDYWVTIASSPPGRVTITCGKARFDLAAEPGDEFPRLPTPRGQGVALGDISHLLRRVAHSVSHDETRYVLNAVLLERTGGFLHATSTDGHRLTTCTEPSEGADVSVLVPRKALSADGELTVHDSVLFFSGGLCCKQIEGKFPDWRQVVPKSADVSLRFNSEDLQAALKRVMLMAGERSKGVRVAVRDGEVELHAQDADRGEASETLACECKAGAEYGFNAAYLLDAVRCVQAEQITIGLTDPLSPCTVQADNAQTVAVVMPMRI